MFTGIIETQGVVRSHKSGGRRAALIEIEAPKIAARMKIGASLSVSGACLTVVRKKDGRLFFNIVPETLKRTTLGTYRVGDRVNLERALKADGRIEGHFVLGHVDGVARVRRVLKKGRQSSFLVSFPPKLRPYLVEKGSVALDGVSLTLGKVSRGGFWVHAIPHTLRLTTLANYRPGTRLNLEADVLAKLAGKI